MLIARVIAEPSALSASAETAVRALEAGGLAVQSAGLLDGFDDVLEFALAGDAIAARAAMDRSLAPADLLITHGVPAVPGVFVSDMDSTMIGQECIDELADFAGLKDRIAAITERAMQGELDFTAALTERVRLLADLSVGAIEECLAQRIRPMPGARVLVETLKARGCATVLVTGGFHQFADPVAGWLGFERVVGNRLETSGGRLTGGLVGPIVDSAVKEQVLREAVSASGGKTSLATGDGANDIPMLVAATYGFAYHAKPKAREAANGVIDRGDLTGVLKLLGIGPSDWVQG